MKEETLRVIFQPSFSELGTQGSSYRVIHIMAKMDCTGSKVTVSCNLRTLDKLFGPFKLIQKIPSSAVLKVGTTS